MCGRYVRRSDKQRIAEAFRLGHAVDELVVAQDWNVAPTTAQPVIRLNRDTGEREMVMMRWGLVPYFAKRAEDFKGFSTINAKAETLEEKAVWRAPLAKRRCIVPADGFYEWKSEGKVKRPFAFTLKSGEPLGFAGLWDAWKDPANGEWLQSFAIITTFANELVAGVHERMPVILRPRDYDVWLRRGEGKAVTQELLALLRPYDAEEMRTDACNPAVGNVRNNGPEMLNSA